MTETTFEDPEVWEATEVAGAEEAYDGLAVESIEYQPALFEPDEIADGSDDDE